MTDITQADRDAAAPLMLHMYVTTGELPLEATDAMAKAGAEFALSVALSSDYTWPDYMKDLWRTMAVAALRAREQ